MTKLGRWIVGIISVVVLLAIGFLVWPNDERAGNGVLRVGFIGPLEGNGAVLGMPILNGAQLALQELRAAGQEVELVVAHDDCDPAQAKVAMQRLLEVERVRFVIGGLCLDQAIALKEFAEEERMILMVPLVPQDVVTRNTRYVFRTTQADVMGAAQLGTHAAATKKHAYVVSETQDEQAAYRNAFINAFVAEGGAVVNNEEYLPGVSDVRRQVSRMKTVLPKPDVLFLNFKSTGIARLYLDEMVKQNVKLPVYGSPIVAGMAEQAAYKTLLSGMLYAEAPELDAEREQVKAFTAAYDAAYGEDGVPAYNAAAYEAMHLIAQAWKAGAVTADAMRAHLLGLSVYEGVQGSYRFLPNGNMTGVPFVLKKVVNGVREVVK